MGIIEGPCGYSTRLVGTLGKLVFQADLGRKCPCGTQNRCFWGVSLLGRLWVQESGEGAVLTMVEQGYDPSVA